MADVERPIGHRESSGEVAMVHRHRHPASSRGRTARSPPPLVSSHPRAGRGRRGAVARDETVALGMDPAGRRLTGGALERRVVLAMIKRRAAAAGLPPSTCCHTFRATGITAYLSTGEPSNTRSRSRGTRRPRRRSSTTGRRTPSRAIAIKRIVIGSTRTCRLSPRGGGRRQWA